MKAAKIIQSKQFWGLILGLAALGGSIYYPQCAPAIKAGVTIVQEAFSADNQTTGITD